MSFVDKLKDRPLVATSLVSAAVALLLVLIPISYNKTVGHEVALSVTGAELTAAEAGEIGNAFAGSVGAEDLRIYPAKGGPGGEKSFKLVANVQSRTKGRIGRLATGFAADLSARGYSTAVNIAPIVERVSNNVYAAGLDCVFSLDIEAEGRSDEAVMADIREQLDAAGCGDDVEIAFNRTGDATMLTIQARSFDGNCGEVECGDLDIRIDGERIDMNDAHTIKVCGDRDMSDSEMEALIREQLEAQGIDADVSVVDGKCRIEHR